VVCDLTAPLPCLDASVDEIWPDNVIEHVLAIPASMREMARIGKTGALVTVRTPHDSSVASWRDPTHARQLPYSSFEHADEPATRHYAGVDRRLERSRPSFGYEPSGCSDGCAPPSAWSPGRSTSASSCEEGR